MTDNSPIHDATELTRFIEARFHARHREQLPPLAEMAARVENVHAAHDRVPDGLAALLVSLIGELEVHMKKEELILFPAIRAGGGPAIANPIAVMRADHDDHEKVMAQILRLTGDLTPPAGACETWAALYGGLAEFLTDMEEHLRLENDVLFPMAERSECSGV